MNPEIRHDPITGRPVLMAPERAARAGAMLGKSTFPDDSLECPFCQGSEDRTPPEIAAFRSGKSRSNEPGWQVRVVPNQFPAVRNDLGQHELIVECPQHEYSLASLPVEQLALVLRMARDRFEFHRNEGKWRYGYWFKNHGPAAGASLSHSHSQILILPNVPPGVESELAAMKSDRCPFCELIVREISEGCRIVRVSKSFVVMTAYAGRFPYETWLLPRKHEQTLVDVDAVADELHWLLNRIDAVVDQPAYNLVLHCGPWDGRDFHWHFELLPRVTGIAGFELGAGMFINPILPEVAANKLHG